MLMLEEIRAQNSATIDAVHGSARELRDDLRRLEARVSTLESAVRYLSGEVMALKAEVGTLKGAMERVEGKLDNKADLARLEALERRVAALESAQA